MDNLKTLARVHTHTHTHTSRNLKEEKRVDNIYSKDIANKKILKNKSLSNKAYKLCFTI